MPRKQQNKHDTQSPPETTGFVLIYAIYRQACFDCVGKRTAKPTFQDLYTAYQFLSEHRNSPYISTVIVREKLPHIDEILETARHQMNSYYGMQVNFETMAQMK